MNYRVAEHLPRLLYLGDVPVEASYHGSALLYRLLEDYPPERMMIVEAGQDRSQPERRIEGVSYRVATTPFIRLSRTRFARWYHSVALLSAEFRARFFLPQIRRYKPDAVVTVTHGHSWITAAEIARQVGLPLHLICHDEWERLGTNRDFRGRIFGEVYRRAASRLCVSPFMAEEYAQRYGAAGEVLYPSRSKDSRTYTDPPARLSVAQRSLTCVFAGTINSSGIVDALRMLANALANLGGRLLIYGPLTESSARKSGLIASNLALCGLVSSSELMHRLREEADVLYVPMSFAKADHSNMRISFPSKLTDYTSVGVPLLIHGPEDCSAVRWARENVGVAEVVTKRDEVDISEAIARLTDPAYRDQLARAALDAGNRYFSHRAAVDTFNKALVRASKGVEATYEV